jgi:hypothetical protein
MVNEISAEPTSLMSENKSNNSRSGFFASPVALIRLGSILFVVLALGHLSAYPWTSNSTIKDTQLVGTMKSVDLVFFGEHTSLWNLYFGWGLWVAVLLLTLAITLWLLSDLARVSPQRIGAITGIISATGLAGAYFSFHFFQIFPSVIVLSVISIILLTAAVRLMRQT